MIRILHVTPYFAPAFCYGGPPRSILGLCRAQQRLGAEVTVFTTTAAGPERLSRAVSKPVFYEGLPVYRFPLGMAARFFHAPQLGPAVLRAVRSGGFDLVHIHGIWNLTEWTAARACRRMVFPYVISIRGMLQAAAQNHHGWRKALAWRLVEREVLRSALFLHATSADEARVLAKLELKPQVVQAANGIDEDGVDYASLRGQFRAQYGIPEAAPVIAWMGRIHPIKRLDILAAAFERVRHTLPQARLVLAGPDENGYRAAIEPLFSIADFRSAVIWTGAISGKLKERLLADANLLAACSDAESFGMSILEAMHAGVPVAVTKTCPWPQIETRSCGRWVPQQPQALAQAMIEILGDREQAESYGRNGEQLVREEYTWDTIAGRMLHAYAQALANKIPQPSAKPDELITES